MTRNTAEPEAQVLFVAILERRALARLRILPSDAFIWLFRKRRDCYLEYRLTEGASSRAFWCLGAQRGKPASPSLYPAGVPSMDGHETSSSANTEQQLLLPTALQLHVLSHLPPNKRALSGRFACRDAADALSDPQHCTASLSQPLPPHAAPWAQEAGQQHVRQLPFQHKFHLLCAAACSGSELNLEVAWALLEPSVFPELLQDEPAEDSPYPDPGVAAVRAGHPHLLGWLLRRCPRLVQPEEVLAAAALHCDLSELQQVWEALRDPSTNGNGNSSGSSSSGSGSVGGSRSRRVELTQEVLSAAAESQTPDAVAKMEWLLAAGADSCCLRLSTAMAAASSGHLGRLRWLRDRGCPLGRHALSTALEQAGLPVVQWLVGEGVCELPPRAGESEDSRRRWDTLLHAAAKATDGVAKLQWLQEQGAPLLTGASTRLAQDLALLAVDAGRVEVVQYLLTAWGPAALVQDPSDQDTFGEAAAKLRSTHMVEYLVREAGFVLSHKAYNWAAEVGGLDMIRWLALEAGVSAAGCDLSSMVGRWPRNTQADSRALLEAVQLVVGAGCSGWVAEQDAIVAAARRGDLALAQFLHRQQSEPPLVGRCQAAAVLGGCAALVEWMPDQPGWLASANSPYRNAARQGDKGTLAALRRLGVPWGDPSVLVWALLEWRCEVPVLRWLAQQGAPVGDTGELQGAVEKAVQSRGLHGDKAAELRSWAAEVCVAATAVARHRRGCGQGVSRDAAVGVYFDAVQE